MNNVQSSPPDNHLVWAILTTVMCCLPLGIVSIIKSTKVEQLWNQGRYEEAQKAADDAKKYAIWSAASIGIFLVLYFIFAIAIFLIQLGTTAANI